MLASATPTNTADTKPRPGASGRRSDGKAGLPVGTPGKDAGKVMDPKKVAEQAQNLSYPAKIALPAILAHNMNQERTLAAYDDETDNGPVAASDPASVANTLLVPTKDGFMQYSVKLLERRITTRVAMKAAPTKSVLDGSLTVSQTAELANEMLNEAQRSRGGDVVREDESRYLVTLRRPSAPDAWTGEVIGYPALYPLATVNVLAANKMVLVLDKNNKKLWQAPLSYNVSHGYGAGLEEENAPYGYGPCVERTNTLYVIDAGTLTAFDLSTGNVLWRVPSVGITGMFFDDQGMIYMNTSTATPDSLKFVNQIDITRKDATIVMKLNPKNGNVLWKGDLGGMINYVSGPYLYSTHSYQADTDEESGPYTMDSIAGRGSYLSIKRINPKNGKVMWEHCDDRCPLDIQFDHNTIRLVFRKEVQILRYLTF